MLAYIHTNIPKRTRRGERGFGGDGGRETRAREQHTDPAPPLQSGATALFSAAMHGHARVVEQLIAARCNVDLANTDDGQTPLYAAARQGHVPVVVHLITVRCNVDLAKTDDGETPLSVAMRKGHTLVANMIRNPNAVEEVRRKLESDEKVWRSMEKEIGVLSSEEREALIKAVRKHAKDLPTNSSGTAKFGIQVRDLLIGKLAHATEGINLILGLDDDANPELSIEGMEKEFRALNIEEVSELFDYILYEIASEKEYPNGIRDRNNVGKTLDDFLQHPIAIKARLNRADVAALRLYTTAVYKYINGPLRDNEGRPHPLPITVLLIIRALRKLRRVGADELSGVSEMFLWRGMKGVKTTEEFIREGGMCTSSPILYL
jgi:hypothetical protein